MVPHFSQANFDEQGKSMKNKTFSQTNRKLHIMFFNLSLQRASNMTS